TSHRTQHREAPDPNRAEAAARLRTELGLHVVGGQDHRGRNVLRYDRRERSGTAILTPRPLLYWRIPLTRFRFVALALSVAVSALIAACGSDTATTTTTVPTTKAATT